MTTVNLHTVLRKYNESTVDQSEQLILKEAQNIIQNAERDDLDVLNKVGLGANIAKAVSIKNRMESEMKFKEVYDLKAIQKLAINYRLRFLPASLYRGTIDPILPTKIKDFAKDNNILLSTPNPHDEWMNRHRPSDKFYILAPSSSFELQKRPKDPIMFYKINDNKFAFVHKWGNDLSISRLVKYYPLRSFGHMATIVYIIQLTACYVVCNNILPSLFIALVSTVISFLIGTLINIFPDFEGGFIQFSNYNWNSKFSD